MIKKTAGIVLNTIKYRETSVIVKIFTRELGLKPYLVNGIRSQGKASKTALYQPLTTLDLVVYDKEKGGLQRISEARILHPAQRIPFDFGRMSVALFMSEVINRSIHEGYQNEWLFDFLQESVRALDAQTCQLAHFPLVFLIGKAKYLGFAPAEPEGFLLEVPSHPFGPGEFLQAKTYLARLMEERYSSSTRTPAPLRKKLLEHLLVFYSEHLGNTSPFRSLPILRQLAF